MTTHQRNPFSSVDRFAVTDAGLETWLLFQRGVDLPAFAAYPLVSTAEGRAMLSEYYSAFADIARAAGTALVLDTPTWRANPDWAATLGHDLDALSAQISASVELVARVRDSWTGEQPCLVSGVIGPRGDGYVIDVAMSADQATEYHRFQITQFAANGVDVVTALTIGYEAEAAGIAHAARAVDLPVVISFTVETDGRLPSGSTLADAIAATDAATDGYISHYMVNCAHPTHFDGALDGPWAARIGGVRANASTLSHAELDTMEELDDGDPIDLARRYVELRTALPSLKVVGGCCGTDHRHVAAMISALST